MVRGDRLKRDIAFTLILMGPSILMLGIGISLGWILMFVALMNFIFGLGSALVEGDESEPDRTVEKWIVRPAIALVCLGFAGTGWLIVKDPRGPLGPLVMTLLGLLLVGGLIGVCLAWFYKDGTT